MKAEMRKLFSALLAGSVAAMSLSGCVSTIQKVEESDYATTVVAEYNGEKVMLDEARFLAILDQYTYEQMYTIYGLDINGLWTQEAGAGSNQTMESYVKTETMKRLLKTKLLCSKAAEYGVTLSEDDKAAVEDEVTEFFDTTTEKLTKASGATEELVRKIYTDNALANRVYDYMVKDTDLKVDPADFRQWKVSYLKVEAKEDAENDTTDYDKLTEELLEKAKDAVKKQDAEQEEAEKKAAEEEDEAEEELPITFDDYSDAFREVYDQYTDAENYTVTTSTVHFAKGSTSYTFVEKACEMKQGEFATFKDEDGAHYVLYLESDYDQESTTEAVQDEVDNRCAKNFDEKYKAIVESVEPSVVYDKIWANVSFDQGVYSLGE